MIASLGIRWTRLAGAALPRVVAILFCLHYPIAAAFAAERDFTDFPATPADRLSLDTLIDLGLAYRAGEVAACHARVEILFDAYLQRHRRFAARRDDPRWRAAWIDHFARTTYREAIGCSLALPHLIVLDEKTRRMPWQDTRIDLPVWCGRFSGQAADPEVMEAIEALVPLAFRYGLEDAAREFRSRTRVFVENGKNSFIAMNPDVTLFLFEREAFIARREDPEAMTDYDVPQNVGPFFLDTITPERRAAVMAAVETGDYRSILDTTADCLPREEFLRSVGADKADE